MKGKHGTKFQCDNCFNWVHHRSTVCEYCLQPMYTGGGETTNAWLTWSIVLIIVLLVLAS